MAQAKITVLVRFVNWDTTVTTGVIKILNQHFQGHVLMQYFCEHGILPLSKSHHEIEST